MILADITSVYKKSGCLDKTTYWPFSVLHVVSTIFEGIMQKQMTSLLVFFLPIDVLIGRFLIPNACLELEKKRIKWFKKDNMGFGGAIITDLSKTFDTLNYDLLFAKLHAYVSKYLSWHNVSCLRQWSKQFDQ